MRDESERVSKHYKGEGGQDYAKRILRPEVRPLQRESAARFAALVGPAGTVVDFGCGSGGLLANLRCARRIGIEPNAGPAEFARAQGIEVFASLDDLEDQSADVVISNHALEHTLNPFHELCEIRRILRPSGRVVMMLPMDDWRAQRRYNPAEPNHHLYTWNPQLIGNLFAEVGLNVDRVDIVTRAYPPKATFMWTRMPVWLWELTCGASAIARRRRQLLITAHNNQAGDTGADMACRSY